MLRVLAMLTAPDDKTKVAADEFLKKLEDGKLGAIAENTSESATSMRNLSFTTVIEVLNSCNCIDNSALLTIINEGVSAIFSNANLTIIKLC